MKIGSGHAKPPKTSDQLRNLHATLRGMVDGVDHIGCVLYGKKDGKLRTYLDSSFAGEGIKGYEYPLSQSRSLNKLALEGGFRLIEDIPGEVAPNAPHSVHILDQGYRTSLTVPMYHKGSFAGFVFFDSMRHSAFPEEKIPILLMSAEHISMLVYHELDSISTLYGAVALSREVCSTRDFETGAHLERMAGYAKLIASGLEERLGLSDEFVEHVYLFAPLHDLGKVGVSDSILLKPGKLTDEEWQIMTTHPEKGAKLLDMILECLSLQDIPDINIARNIVLHHHEMMDGSGYPQGLKGEKIPLEARIATVADTFDALTSRRPYKEPWSIDRAFEELHSMAGAGKLDQRCVKALWDHREEVRTIHAQYHSPDDED